jgi:TP901 family phage tail tape measure protein
MASNSKEYKMLFELNGQLNNGFTSSFSKAQTVVREMQKELDRLNSEQSQISSYERQQGAIERTKSKLELLQKQYDNIQKEIAETGQYSSDLENKLLSKQAQIDKTSNSLQQQTGKLDQLGQAMSEAGIDVNHLGEEQERLAKETDELKQAQTEAAEHAQKMGDATTDAINGMATAVIGAGLIDKFKDLAASYKECLDVSGDFQAEMSQVAATMGTTSDNVQGLADYAKEMGATTAFTAVQSAEGLNILAMSGLDAQQQIAGLPTVLDLAAAGGMDLATSAGYVTTTVKGFSDSMDNAGYYADLMAKGATMANTNVAQLGEALATSGATAANYSQSADSVTLSLLRLAEQGKTGSEAGTMLNRTMADLYTPTDEAATALDGLGVSAYDASGHAKDFNELVDELKTALSGMSEEEKNATLNTIFTTNGLQAFNKMTVSTTEKVNQFRQGLAEASGSTAKQAETQLDNMNGAYTIMQSAIEGTRISLGELWQDDMTEIYKLTGDLLTQLNEFIKNSPTLVKAIMAGGAAVGVMTAGLVAYKAITLMATTATEIFGATLGGVPIMAVVGGLAALTAGVVALADVAGSSVDPMDQLTYSSEEQQQKLESLQAQYDEAVKKYGLTSDEASRLKYQIDDLNASIGDNGETLQDTADKAQAFAENFDTLQESFDDQRESVKANEAENLALIAKLEDLASSTNQTAGTQAAMKAIIDQLNGSIDGLNLSYDDLTKNQAGSIENLKKLAKAQADQELASEQVDEYVNAVKQQSLAEEALRKSKEELASATEAQKKAQADYNAELDRAQTDSMYGGGPIGIMVDTNGLDRANAAVETAQQNVDTYKAKLDEANAAIAETEQAWKDAQEAAEKASEAQADGSETILTSQEAVAEAVESVQQELYDLADAYGNAYDSAESSFNGMYSIFDEATMKSDEYVQATVKNAQAALDSQLKYWQSYADNIETLKSKSAEDLGITQQQYDALMSQLQDGSEQSAGLANDIVKNLSEGNGTAVQKLAETANSVNTTKQELAESVADWQTNFNSTMDELVQKMDTTVDDLDMSDGAAASAKSTIESYAQQIARGQGAAVNAAENIVKAVARTFANSPSIQVRDSGSLIGKEAKKIGKEVEANATGTLSSADVFIAGENGPELIIGMKGSEVFPASETDKIIEAVSQHNGEMPVSTYTGDGSGELVNALASANDANDIRVAPPQPVVSPISNADADPSSNVLYFDRPSREAEEGTTVMSGNTYSSDERSYSPNINVNFNIEGSATEEVITKLQQYGDDFAERVLDVIQNNSTDLHRMAFG